MKLFKPRIAMTAKGPHNTAFHIPNTANVHYPAFKNHNLLVQYLDARWLCAMMHPLALGLYIIYESGIIVRNKFLLGGLIGLGSASVLAVFFGYSWVKEGLDFRRYILNSSLQSCLDASDLFANISMNSTLASNPERWNIETECAIYGDSLEKSYPYINFIVDRYGDWDRPGMKEAWFTAYDALVDRSKAARSDIAGISG